MKKLIRQFINLTVIITLLSISPTFLTAQNNRPVAELTIINNSPTGTTGEGFVTVNKERVVNGRSILSPSEIVTSPQTRAKISIPQNATILIEPNSKFYFSFADASLAGKLFDGEATVESLPNTFTNIWTPKGTVTVVNKNQLNVFSLSSKAGDNIRVNTLNGQVLINDTLVSAGEVYPRADNSSSGGASPDTSSSDGFNKLLIIGVIAAAAAGIVLIALAVNDDEEQIVSPVR